MRLANNILKNSKIYNEIKKSFDNNIKSLNINGVVDSFSSLLISDIAENTNNNIVVVCATEIQARKIFEEIQFSSSKDVLYFPKKELMIDNVFTESRELLWDRVSSINKIVSDENEMIIVTNIEAVIYRLCSFDDWKNSFINLKVGEQTEFNLLATKLIQMGYERVDLTETPGHFSIRGGIVDIYPSDLENPVRIEFFADDIDSIRYYSAENQKSFEKLSKIVIKPAKEGIYNEQIKEKLIESMKREGINYNDIENNIFENMIDKFSPYIYDYHYTIFDYINKYDLFFIDHSKVMSRYDRIYEDFIERFKHSLERNEVFPKQVELISTKEDILRNIIDHKFVSLNSFYSENNYFKFEEEISFKIGAITEYFGKLDVLFNDIENLKKRGYKTYLIITDKEKIDLILKVAKEKNFIFDYIEKSNQMLLSSQSMIINGEIDSGFVILPTKTIVITEKEIFGQRKKRKIKRYFENSQIVKSFRELKNGDYVVHEFHGIGKYVGVEQVELGEVKKDYIKIQYKNDEYLYIQIEQMNSIQKYIGGDIAKVKANKLGTAEWQKVKTRAKRAIEDMTDELIKLYSERVNSNGFSFSLDTDWQREFESLFPYVETQDQLKSIVDIKKDMEKIYPMDRLLCGDVGYGKTEVALRAVFKAIVDSKQVAILVPTTILAQQHYNTMMERFSKYPIKVEMLSRFRNKNQQEKIIKDMRKGLLDVIVGTHRLLSNDVKFKDLGLLIIDEEHRFGVKHKEKIKEVKINVDVLTLTATPIPRTLNMSMIGVRDLSLIEDPPEDRYPIQTYVVEFNENIVREAIVREIDRSGQVFFVYNKVKTIGLMTDRLRDIIPEAKIEHAHGQMNEKNLSDVMLRFLNKEFDVLVSTTIIENGLDISNVNTIIVVDADKMGLSQLYQLRGRVGRSNRVAYAYLTVKKNKTISEIAQKRLFAIKEFTELGSGFKIAMRDLEIRGAGNILGAQQHGHLESIGYELYMKLLKENMDKVNGEIKEIETDTSIEIKIDSYIPVEYISDVSQKLEIYKKIASIESKKDLYEIEEEIEDRYGEIPASVHNLLAISYIRLLASKMHFSSVSEFEQGFILKMDQRFPISPEKIVEIANEYKNNIKINLAQNQSNIYFYDNNSDRIRQRIFKLEMFLEKIISLNN